jgi:hypothetical protein
MNDRHTALERRVLLAVILMTLAACLGAANSYMNWTILTERRAAIIRIEAKVDAIATKVGVRP